MPVLGGIEQHQTRCQRRRKRALNSGRSNVHGLGAHFGPKLARERRHRRLAVRAGDGRDDLGLRLEPECSTKRQRLPRVFDNDQGNVAFGQNIRRDTRPLAVCQNCARAHPNCVLNERAAMHLCARKRTKQVTVLDLATVHRQPRHTDIAGVARGQPKL